MKLVLPMPDNIANARMHWRTKQAAKKRYWALLDIMLHSKTLPTPPTNAPLKARIKAAFYLWSPMDDGNAMNRLKWIEDWLKAWGYITDDSRRHLEYAGFPEQHIDRKHQRIEIEITDATPPPDYEDWRRLQTMSAEATGRALEKRRKKPAA